jgi:hypothetical protein
MHNSDILWSPNPQAFNSSAMAKFALTNGL